MNFMDHPGVATPLWIGLKPKNNMLCDLTVRKSNTALFLKLTLEAIGCLKGLKSNLVE